MKTTDCKPTVEFVFYHDEDGIENEYVPFTTDAACDRLKEAIKDGLTPGQDFNVITLNPNDTDTVDRLKAVFIANQQS